jgi:hypothetical protein
MSFSAKVSVFDNLPASEKRAINFRNQKLYGISIVADVFLLFDFLKFVVRRLIYNEIKIFQKVSLLYFR